MPDSGNAGVSRGRRVEMFDEQLSQGSGSPSDPLGLQRADLPESCRFTNTGIGEVYD
jgi:hypothetical protein